MPPRGLWKLGRQLLRVIPKQTTKTVVAQPRPQGGVPKLCFNASLVYDTSDQKHSSPVLIILLVLLLSGDFCRRFLLPLFGFSIDLKDLALA
jgi:hypothetical protein